MRKLSILTALILFSLTIFGLEIRAENSQTNYDMQTGALYQEDSCDLQMPGDCDNNGLIAVLDLTYLISVVYNNAPLPDPSANLDVNGDCCINWSDVSCLQRYLSGIWPFGCVPVECTCVNPPLCLSTPNEPIVGLIRHSVDGFVPSDGSPIWDYWYSLWPDFGNRVQVISWKDNDDNNMISLGDIIVVKDSTSERTSERIERVAPTITVTSLSVPEDTTYFDLVDPANPNMEPIEDPVGSFWQEAYPDFGIVSEIQQSNNDGTLGIGDEIEMLFQNGPDSGNTQSYIVRAIETDMITTPMPLEGEEYDHNIDGYYPCDGTPMGTTWQELYPDYDRELYVYDWEDNDDHELSYGDLLKMTVAGTSDTVFKHIEGVTATLKLTVSESETLFVDQAYGNNGALPIDDPINTFWFAVYPNLDERLLITDWIDNGSGILDSCDYIEMMRLSQPDSGIFFSCHVEDFATDIVSTQRPVHCDCIPGDADGNEIHNILDVTSIITYLYMEGPAPYPYELCSGDWNCDCVVNILDVTTLITYLYIGDFPICDCDGWIIRCGMPLRK